MYSFSAHRHLFAVLFLGLAAIGIWTTWPASAQDRDIDAAPVLRVELDSPIHPMATRFVSKVLDEAAERGAAAVVIELNTPGGSLPATRRLCQAFLASEVPVIVYVSPGGAQAASAGFFLLMAADVAAMAPGTNTGSAHPVTGDGEDIEGAMGDKVLEDALALVRSLAEQRGRDLEVVQAAVSESRSMTATEALDAGIADAVADDLPSLLAQLDGRTVRSGDDSRQLAFAEAAVLDKTMSADQRLLATLAHPQIAGLLMAFGMLGIYAEISNPGLIFPGVFGGICLILGFFALSVLPINYAGLALLLLALVLFVTETQVPSFGVLTLGGAVSLALGLIMLVDEMDPAMRPNPW
ncbi:MAG: ATP-dependent Clp protease proteolytic subunit, partial [Acidobacteriota bacterium]